MSIWAIADIHASRVNPETGQIEKPMDVFGEHWADHVDRIERAWRLRVRNGDTVIVAGDIDWGLRLDEAMETLDRLASWPGEKILVRGNHDYWWSSKTTSRVRRALPPSIALLHNDAIAAEGFNISGTKGSPVPGAMDWSQEDSKLLNREVQRLELSLQDREPGLPTIVALHFPPFYNAHPASPFRDVLERSNVAACVYGHLHGRAGRSGPQGCLRGIEYQLVAADAVGFKPVLIASHGQVIPAERQTESRQRMDHHVPLDDLRELAEEEIAEKRVEVGDEAQARELYDIPTETDARIAEQQEQERG